MFCFYQETKSSGGSPKSSRGEPTTSTIPGPSAPTQGPKPKTPSDRPASLRQCEIQEELLAIQKLKLAEKRKQTAILEAILETLRAIQSSVNNSATPEQLLNSMQGF